MRGAVWVAMRAADRGGIRLVTGDISTTLVPTNSAWQHIHLTHIPLADTPIATHLTPTHTHTDHFATR